VSINISGTNGRHVITNGDLVCCCGFVLSSNGIIKYCYMAINVGTNRCVVNVCDYLQILIAVCIK